MSEQLRKILGVDLYVKLTKRQLQRYEAETLKALGRGEIQYCWPHQFDDARRNDFMDSELSLLQREVGQFRPEKAENRPEG